MMIRVITGMIIIVAIIIVVVVGGAIRRCTRGIVACDILEWIR